MNKTLKVLLTIGGIALGLGLCAIIIYLILNQAIFNNIEDNWLAAPRDQENRYMTDTRILLGLQLKYTQFVNKDKGINAFAEAGYRYLRNLSGQESCRHSLWLTLGVTF